MKEDGIKEGVTGKCNQKRDKPIEMQNVILWMRKLRLREEHEVLSHSEDWHHISWPQTLGLASML